MKRLLLVLPLVSLVCFACSGEDPRDAIVTVSERVPDRTDETRGMTTKFYDSDNPYTKEVLSKLRKNPAVQAELARFGAEGYVLSPSHSFVTEGDDRTGRHAEVAVLSLGNPADANNAINLHCIRSADVQVVVPIRLSADETFAKEEGYEKIGDGVWMSVIESPASRTDSEPGRQNAWGWRRWGRCVLSGIVSGGIGCHFSCRALIIGYTQCMAACGGAVIVATLIQCTFAEL